MSVPGPPPSTTMAPPSSSTTIGAGGSTTQASVDGPASPDWMHVTEAGAGGVTTVKRKSCVESPTVTLTDPTPVVLVIVSGTGRTICDPVDVKLAVNDSPPGVARAPLAVATSCHCPE